MRKTPSKYINTFLLVIIWQLHLLANHPAFASSISDQELVGSKYLSPPTGTYGVAYEDFHWVNTHACPDPFFNGKNQADFSLDNQSEFCREIMARIYYPTDIKIYGSLYYPPLVANWQNDIRAAQVPGITEKQIEMLSFIQTYTIGVVSIAKQKSFPVLIFNPGLNSDAQGYVNFITDIVSHGYIVVAINNTFISAAVEFPDGHIVTSALNDEHASESKITQAGYSDIIYIYQKIHRLHQLHPIFSAMDLQHIGLFGHSFGAWLTVKLVHQHPDWLQAAAALDAPARPPTNNPTEGFVIPFLHLHAADWRARYAHVGTFMLRKDGYMVLLTPDVQNTNYSEHENFSDLSTLQYQPTVNAYLNHYAQQGLPTQLGTMDGYDAVKQVNQYLIQFFDVFLKDMGSPIFKNCAAFKNTLLVCGPERSPY